MVDFKNAKPIFKYVPPKIIIYGRNGIGKSRFAMQAPNPIFLDMDKNLAQYKIVTNESEGINFALDTFQKVLDFLSLLINQEHDFKTLVIDSLSTLNTLIEKQIKKEKNVDSIAEIQWGKGPDLVKVLWEQTLDKLEFLWKKRKMMIILIGHDQLRETKDKINGDYHRYVLSLHEKSEEPFRHWCSIMLFAADQRKFKEDIGKFGRVDKKIIESRKVLYTDDGALFVAKNTYNLPKVIAFDDVEEAWNTFYSHISSYYETTDTEKKEK